MELNAHKTSALFDEDLEMVNTIYKLKNGSIQEKKVRLSKTGHIIHKLLQEEQEDQNRLR